METNKHTIAEVATTLNELTKMNEVYVMNLLIDVEGRIKTKEIYGGNHNFSESHFSKAGDYIFDTYMEMNPKQKLNFEFDKPAMDNLYFKVDKNE